MNSEGIVTATEISTAPERGPAGRDTVHAELGVLRAHLLDETPEALAAAEARLHSARLRLAAPSTMDEIATGFGLSLFERSVLLLAAGPELVAAVADELAAVAGGPRLTFGLALAVLPHAHWSAMTPASPLRQWALIHLLDPTSVTGSPLAVDERVLHHIAGAGHLDVNLAAMCRTAPSRTDLPPTLSRAAQSVAKAWRTGRVPVVHGPQPANLHTVVASAAAGTDRALLVIRGEDLPTDLVERGRLWRRMEREAILLGCTWALDVVHDHPGEAHAAIRALRNFITPVAVIAGTVEGRLPEPALAVHVDRLGVRERRSVLRFALRRSGAVIRAADVDTAAAVFDLTLPDIDRVTRDVQVGTSLWSACRAGARIEVGALAQTVEPRVSWADLVLPPAQTEQLRALVAAVRHRSQVLGDWGFDARTTRGLGMTALFAGPSGTGKTMAAEVVAHELSLDLVHVDLSQVVSKYIGDTEKQLRHVFDAAEDGAAVLLFDEADTLFGKRSDVRDSHDRYANLEVGYLLQRVEAFRGLAILTTNNRSALDQAFTRRLGAVVTFPYPDADQRLRLWERAFPSRTPLGDVDIEKLSLLDVSGGAIASIALTAAFLGAADGGKVRDEHIQVAARWELAKSGRSTPPRGTFRETR